MAKGLRPSQLSTVGAPSSDSPPWKLRGAQGHCLSRKRTEINSKYNYWDSKKRYFQRAATGSTTAKSFKEFGIDKAAEIRVLNGIQISLKKTF